MKVFFLMFLFKDGEDFYIFLFSSYFTFFYIFISETKLIKFH